MENPIKMDDLGGFPHFWKHVNMNIHHFQSASKEWHIFLQEGMPIHKFSRNPKNFGNIHGRNQSNRHLPLQTMSMFHGFEKTDCTLSEAASWPCLYQSLMQVVLEGGVGGHRPFEPPFSVHTQSRYHLLNESEHTQKLIVKSVYEVNTINRIIDSLLYATVFVCHLQLQISSNMITWDVALFFPPWVMAKIDGQ